MGLMPMFNNRNILQKFSAIIIIGIFLAPTFSLAGWHGADDESNGGSRTLTLEQADGYGLILAVTDKCPNLYKNRGWMSHIPRFYPEMLPNEVRMVDERWGWHMVQEKKLSREDWCREVERKYVGEDKPLLRPADN